MNLIRTQDSHQRRSYMAVFTLRPFSTTSVPRTLFFTCHWRLWRIRTRSFSRHSIGILAALLPLSLESRQINHSHPPRKFLLFRSACVIHMLFRVMIVVTISGSVCSCARSALVVTTVSVELIRWLKSGGTSCACSRHGSQVSRRGKTVMHRTEDVTRRRVQRESTVVGIDRYLRQRNGRMG